jgi:thiol-disulfide isomerase/thioredoxin
MRRKTAALAGAVVVGVLAGMGLYLIVSNQGKVETPSSAAATTGTKIDKGFAKDSLTAFVVKPDRPAVAEFNFTDKDGKRLSLANWKGRVVLLNLWATWCAPCRKEMPSLAELQEQLGSKDFEVVAVSLDRQGEDVAAKFLEETNASALALYLDKESDSLDKLRVVGLPASILIDRQGREIGRIFGPAEWASPEALELIKAAMAELAA